MTNEVNMNKEQELEKLLLSEDLEELNSLTNTFNIFNTLKLQNNEIRHSNFLSWLMTPYENHGVGDYFLKEFLKIALREHSTNKNINVTLSDIIFNDFSDAEIRREYKNIDILIISPKNKFVCIIENKVWSVEHSNQLQRYAKVINKEFPSYDKKMGIFLTPVPVADAKDNIIERETDGQTYHYIQMNYEQVFDVINRTLKFKSHYMNNEIKIFIEHYKKMLERNIMGNTDTHIAELCKKIYREHKNAIDLIIQNNDEKSDIFNIFIEMLSERNDISKSYEISGNTVKFLPNGIKNIEKLKFGVNNKIIVCLHTLFYGKKPLYIEVVLEKADENDNESILKRENLANFLIERMNLKRFNGSKDWAYSPSITLIEFDEFRNMDGDKETVKNFLSDKLDSINYINSLKDALNDWNY